MLVARESMNRVVQMTGEEAMGSIISSVPKLCLLIINLHLLLNFVIFMCIPTLIR